MDVGLGWLAAVLNLDKSIVLLCSLSRTEKRLLLTEQSAEVQTGHNDFVLKDVKSSGYLFIIIGEARAYAYANSGSQCYV